MAKMLQSMAMLHQAQQQQAILAGLPKRGRGSRGGGMGLSKKAGIAIKLKRLERYEKLSNFLFKDNINLMFNFN